MQPPSATESGFRSGQWAPNAYSQKRRMNGVELGPVIWTWVRRTPTVPVAGTMWAVVPVPPTQP